jgi:asparagine synthase (glutamine-hydrolysing)
LPGLYLAFAENGLKTCKEHVAADLFPATINNISYPSKLLVDGDKTILGYTYHDNYSVLTFEDSRFVIFVDGLIYGKTSLEIRNELGKISESVFLGRLEAKNIIANWIRNTDGEYVVLLLDKSSDDILVFNDRMGRLPVYYSQTTELLLVSRNPWNLINITGNSDFDRNAISEYLLFGYPLGNKTVLKNVFQLEGASCIRTGAGSGETSYDRLFTYNFDEKTSGSESISSHADNIVELLYEACKNRIDNNFKTVLALSGGLDSRSIAICLNNTNIDFSAATFLDYYGIFRPDVALAGQIAKALGIDQKTIHLSRASGKDVLDLLIIKCGMNYLGVSFSIPMIRRIMKTYGMKITLFTGDGGDKVLRDTTPAKRVSSFEELIEYTLTYNGIMRLEVMASITGADERELVSRLRDRLARYEEKEMKMKYLHFIFNERCPKWHFQGEDRNRAFVRHVAPFYASRLFEYSMRLPDHFKKNFRLYREVLTRLSPTVAAIPNPEWNLPITSRKLGIYNLARDLYFHMPDRLKTIIQRRHRYTKKASVYSADSPVMKCLDSQLQNCPAIQQYLSVDGIRRNIENLDKMGFDHLFTLTSLIEMVHCGSSSINKYLETELI